MLTRSRQFIQEHLVRASETGSNQLDHFLHSDRGFVRLRELFGNLVQLVRLWLLAEGVVIIWKKKRYDLPCELGRKTKEREDSSSFVLVCISSPDQQQQLASPAIKPCAPGLRWFSLNVVDPFDCLIDLVAELMIVVSDLDEVGVHLVNVGQCSSSVNTIVKSLHLSLDLLFELVKNFNRD